MSHWQATAKQTIDRAYAEGESLGLTGAALKAHVNAAYPFGLRSHHPYKVWCSELRKRFGTSVVSKADAARLAAWNGGAKQ
jgi:hypothetical protein